MNDEIPFGHLDVVEFSEEARWIRLKGWVVTPSGGPDHLVATVEGAEAVQLDLVPRPDVQAAFPAIPKAAAAGYSLAARLPQLGPGTVVEARLEISREWKPVATQNLGYRLLGSDWDLPAPHLMHRVSRSSDMEYFKISGGRNAADMLRTLKRHRDPARVRRFLDWGCGCGRLTRHLVELFPQAEAFATDIDEEAMAWLQAHAPRGSFRATGLMPPLPFEDDSFDLVVASSVFTHLTQAAQAAWLEEMRRVIEPGGLLLATTHGPHSAVVMSMMDVVAELERTGFHDAIPDHLLGEVASGEYYRATFQSLEYTRRVWGGVFEIRDCIVGGTNYHQDLWLLQKPR